MTVAPAHHHVETYTPAELEALSREFKIPDAQRTELAKLLEDAAAIWRWHHAAQKGIGTPAKSTKALNDVSKHARKLGAALRDLPPKAYAALAAEATSAENELLIADADLPKFLGVMVPEQDGSETPVTLDVQDIACLIDTLGQLAKRASTLPPGRKGKPANQALRIWISNIETFWTGTLGWASIDVILGFSHDLTLF